MYVKTRLAASVGYSTAPGDEIVEFLSSWRFHSDAIFIALNYLLSGTSIYHHLRRGVRNRDLSEDASILHGGVRTPATTRRIYLPGRVQTKVLGAAGLNNKCVELPRWADDYSMFKEVHRYHASCLLPELPRAAI